MEDILRHIAAHEADYLDELRAVVAIPSISSLSEHKPDMLKCAEHLADRFRAIGLEHVAVLPTEGHPAVYADWLGAPGEPTALLYGHYDVQPVDPLHLWDSPPFEATIRGGDVFARGIADDKGQVMMHWAALEAHLRTNGRLPMNVKLIIEGEEEIGSAHFGPFVARERERLAADVLVISDTSRFSRELPSLTYGLRGLVYIQIDLTCASHDLHSGSYGGGVGNPIEALARVLASLRDEAGHVLVPGFYDDVQLISAAEKAELARLPFDDASFVAETGAPATHGEAGYSTLERLWTRPTLDPNGIWGGFTGEGSKTVLPSRASAKVSCRLVPDQDPDRIVALLTAEIARLCPAWATVVVTKMDGGRPTVTALDHPATIAAGRAIEAGFGKKPVFVRSGGSIPIVAVFRELLGTPVVLMGFAPPDDYAHAPNERLDLAGFSAGIRSAAHLWPELASALRQQ